MAAFGLFCQTDGGRWQGRRGKDNNKKMPFFLFLHARRVLLEPWWLAKSPIRVKYPIRAERGTELGGADSMEMEQSQNREGEAW